MIATAKIRSTEHRQTVLLPPGFEFASDEVWVRKDETNGEIILTPKAPGPDSDGLKSLFILLDEAPLPPDFLAERSNPVEVPQNPLEDWSA